MKSIIIIIITTSKKEIAVVISFSNSPAFWLTLFCFLISLCFLSSSLFLSIEQQIRDHRTLFSAAAFELFNLGPNSQLIINDFTDVAPLLTDMKLDTLAMVSSYPYPEDFITWMRQLFTNPKPFVERSIDE
jgi:hypothetical protein